MRPGSCDGIDRMLFQVFDRKTRFQDRTERGAIEEGMGYAAFVALGWRKSERVDARSFSEAFVPTRTERRVEQAERLEIFRD
jgi:hypothetical protein